MADIPLRDTVPLEAIQLESDLTYEEKPVKILEFAGQSYTQQGHQVLQSSVEPPYRGGSNLGKRGRPTEGPPAPIF